MNYRHAFHAGNFADVMKHAALALAIEALKRKEKPFFLLDTHAGRGAYDLGGTEAQKTGEAARGVGRLLDAPATALPAGLTPYLGVIRAMNPAGGWRHYPGSPEIAARLLRAHDRIALVELHPEDAQALRARYRADRRIAVHQRDAHDAAKGLVPPPERRGLVLIDPPFEARDEFQRLERTLARLRRVWPGGVALAWYPIKGRAAADRLHEALRAAGGPPSIAAEMWVRPPADPFRLDGSGLVVVNPPWGMAEALADLLPALGRLLAPEQGGGQVVPLVEERPPQPKV